MRAFKFRLRRLERLRHAERRESEAEFSAAMAEVRQAQQRCRRVERSLLELGAHWSEKLDGESTAGDLKQLAQLTQRLREAAARERELEATALERAEECRVRHVEKVRAHRVLERLGERRRLRWLEEIGREEQRLLDELHLARIVETREREESA